MLSTSFRYNLMTFKFLLKDHGRDPYSLEGRSSQPYLLKLFNCLEIRNISPQKVLILTYFLVFGFRYKSNFFNN